MSTLPHEQLMTTYMYIICDDEAYTIAVENGKYLEDKKPLVLASILKKVYAVDDRNMFCRIWEKALDNYQDIEKFILLYAHTVNFDATLESSDSAQTDGEYLRLMNFLGCLHKIKDAYGFTCVEA